MTEVLEHQRALLQMKLDVLLRLQTGLNWSLQRLPAHTADGLLEPATSERISAIVDRFAKLQDQFAGALRHAHSMLGEKSRSFNDVVDWAVRQGILADAETWLALRALRNRLTYEYDLESDRLPELMAQVRATVPTLANGIHRFTELSSSLGLLPSQSSTVRQRTR